MERLELSKQKLLGPKSSASTNFATSAEYSFIFIKETFYLAYKPTSFVYTLNEEE